MQITTQEWVQLMKYISKELLKERMDMGEPGGLRVNGVSVPVIEGLPSWMKLEDYIADTGTKKERKKPVQVDTEYEQGWKKFWSTWPSTKSVPGTQYRSGAKMKGNEQGMYKKWLAAIVSNISVERMQYAAECYLQWAYTESISKGRNELEYRNAMEPWLNQSLYLNYADVPMPPIAKQQVQYQNSTDQ